MSSDAVDLAAWAGDGVPDDDSRDTLFATLAHELRRETVSALLDERAPLQVAELATRVTEATAGRAEADDRTRVYVALVHNHLPTLEAAGFVVCDTDADSSTVEASGELVAYRRAVEAVLSAASDRSPDDASGELTALSDRRRRAVLAALDGSPSLSLAELASRVVDRESETDADADSIERLEAEVRTALHHVHLPKLVGVDFARYDPETRTVERGDSEFVDRLSDAAFPSVEW
ncbi:DUF7344 domain-containing protein [Haloprofundus halophilus]|uniref:DUF7344 domain-containing protein n=1 Tax=Haloprofundus halophilus TaxID=2283527 RepID=UPI001300AC8C|nr:hypothetical protein [Haloprofundus halophilus]